MLGYHDTVAVVGRRRHHARMISSIQKRPKRTYDHRLRELVRDTGDPRIVADYGVPRSTAAGWLRGDCQAVVTADGVDKDCIELQAEIAKLRWRNRKLIATVRLLVAFLRTVGIRLDRRQLPKGEGRTRLLREIERARGTLSL